MSDNLSIDRPNFNALQAWPIDEATPSALAFNGGTTLMARADNPPEDPNSLSAILGRAISAGTPDAIVYSNSALLAPANAKSFVLANPLTGSYTHFISHPQNTINVMGVPFGRVEAIHYITNGTGTRREDGFGFVEKVGKGQNQITVFINGRVGDTNRANNPNNGVSVNFGFFGSPAAVQQLIDRLPAGGRAGKVKEALELVLRASTVGGTQLGLAWRGSLQMNLDTGQVELNISGVKIPLRDLQAALRDVNAINYGDKPIARVNNEEAYLNGANPFRRADDTRVPNGPYVNQGEPVTAIAADVLALQDRLEGADRPNIRTNDEARRFLEYAIERSTWLTPEQQREYRNVDGIEGAKVDPNPMSDADKAKLKGLLVQLYRHGVYFGSAKIEAAAVEAAKEVGAKPADNETRAFVRDVYEGTYRYPTLQGYNAGDLARDVALGLNRWTAVITEVFRADPVERDDIWLQQDRQRIKGLAQRLERDGGVLSALGLRVPEGRSAADAKAIATPALARKLAPRVTRAGQTLSAQSLYEAFQGLGAAQRQAIGREIQGVLDTRASGGARSGDRTVIDGVAIVGGTSSVKFVGGINPEGQALQGELMGGRSDNGSPVFWLAGKQTNYLLHDARGQLITNQADAEERARQLIRNRGATDLRLLDARFVPPSGISGTPSRIQSVGARNPDRQGMQGELMFARDGTGNPVFWLQGRSTNFLLRDANGALIRNQADAVARARELIRVGVATDLRRLDERYL